MAEMAERNGVNHRDEIRFCVPCDMSFSDIFDFAEHLESKQHVNAIKNGAMQKKFGRKFLAAKAKLDQKDKIDFELLNISDEEGKQPVKNSSDRDDDSVEDNEEDEVYTCELCKKICTGKISYRLHLEGRKHKKNLRNQKLLEDMKERNMVPEVIDVPKEDSLFDKVFATSRHISPKLECKTCEKTDLGPDAYKQHCESERHLKKVALNEYLKENGIQNTHFAVCDICVKTFSGPVPYLQHMESPAHLKQQSLMEEMKGIGDLSTSKEGETKFECKPCNKTFTGPAPFSIHMTSTAHEKMMRKIDLIIDLQKKHPEFVKTAITENSGDSGDNDFIFGCSVCCIVFSGPESARDHFESSKHKKAVKKKGMFKEFKQQQKAEKTVSGSNGANKSVHSDSEDDYDIIKIV